MKKQLILSSFLLYLLTTPPVMADRSQTIARLDTHIKQLYNVYKNKKSSLILQLQHRNIDKDIGFKHDLLTACMHEVFDKNDLSPLVNLWETYQKNPQAVDEQDLFVKEMTVAVYYVYQTLLHQVSLEKHRDIAITDVIALYTQLMVLPIDKLLDMLDECLRKFNAIMELYSLPKNEQTWEEWFRRYWWVMPVVIAALATTFYRHYSRNADELSVK